MKYLLVSDIHGSLSSLEKVLHHFHSERCDMLCVLGDILNYGPRNRIPADIDPKGIAERLNAMNDRVIALRGNCDSEVDQMLLHTPMMSDYVLLADNGHRLFLTHGHVYNENNRPTLRCGAFIYGHTHLWKLHRADDGTVVCNLGSVTFPKNGNPPTFAIYDNATLTVCSLDGTPLKTLCLDK